jgi:MFS family permease
MSSLARTLLLIAATSAAWAFSFGVGSQVISHWLRDHGASNTVIGLNHSAYYLGLAAASLAVPAVVRRLGTRAAALGMIVSGLVLIFFPFAGGMAGWFVLRFVNGGASALALIPLETLVSQQSPPQSRSRNFSFYAVALTLGGAVGLSTGLALYEIGAALAFMTAGVSPLVAGAVLAFRLGGSRLADADGGGALGWLKHFLSFGTAWYQGFLEGGMLAFLSLYLVATGVSPDAAGLLMGATLVGVIALQVPVAWAADRVGTRPILLACYAGVAGSLLATPRLESWTALAGCQFVFGACSGAMYPLGLAMLGGPRDAGQTARAYSWYLALECVGSQMGAAVMGQARDWWGEASMFAVGVGAMAVVFVPWLALSAVRRRAAGSATDQTAGRRAA